MMMDAATMARVIRITVSSLKEKNPNYESEPARSILIAFNELASVFEELTEKRRAERMSEGQPPSS